MRRTVTPKRGERYSYDTPFAGRGQRFPATFEERSALMESDYDYRQITLLGALPAGVGKGL